ncbi:MAG TPA: nucleoside triphosphate pyrophosphohydrolase [Candidatus Dormibacteraeota bacterium]|nr:nucleoside triphosphate pyrophosphohydrolase [Candidatus Dormibacteraeota bacterium]
MAEHPDRPYPDGIGAIFEIARRLRAPDGCPWDREQTHESLRPYLLEETYEVLEAIDRGLDDARLREELGDLLLQVAMHSAIAEEEGRFDAAQVSEAAAAKIVARHPHVFGDARVADAEEVLRNWEHRKLEEAAREGRPEETPLDRVPSAMPALAWVHGMQKRAARVGFDPGDVAEAAEVVAARAREAATAADHEEAFRRVGDLLLAAVTLARKLRVSPEDALRAAGQRFRDRFAVMHRELLDRGVGYRDLDPAELSAVWDRAGASPPSPPSA